MRPSSLFAVFFVSALAACGSPDRSTTPPAAGHVKMTLTCLPDGSLGFNLIPWSVTLPNKNAAFTWDSDSKSNADGTISAVNQQFPFGTEKFMARHGSNVVGKPIKDTPAGTYKYSVTVICPAPGGKSDTTIVDPDMIIPWKIEAN